MADKCNFCNWKEDQEKAKEIGVQLRAVEDTGGGKWPKGKRIEVLKDTGWEPYGIWYAEIPDKCVC